MSCADSEESGFAAAAVQRTLGHSTDVDACVALARRIAALMGDALQYFRREQGAIACQAGCNFCCHLRVMVFPHEAIALHRHLGSRLPREQAQQVRERLLAGAQRLTQAPPGSAAPGVPRSPCAFLVEGQCSVYEVRPSACAGYHSLSREACERDHESSSAAAAQDPQAAGGIPVSQAMQHVATALSAGLATGLAHAGLSPARVELQTAVAALLAEPALIARWRAGRDWACDASGRVRTKGK
jgi:Fe-S-cluster containining protein